MDRDQSNKERGKEFVSGWDSLIQKPSMLTAHMTPHREDISSQQPPKLKGPHPHFEKC